MGNWSPAGRRGFILCTWWLTKILLTPYSRCVVHLGTDFFLSPQEMCYVFAFLILIWVYLCICVSRVPRGEFIAIYMYIAFAFNDFCGIHVFLCCLFLLYCSAFLPIFLNRACGGFYLPNVNCIFKLELSRKAVPWGLSYRVLLRWQIKNIQRKIKELMVILSKKTLKDDRAWQNKTGNT